jgi:ABC-type Fe3+-citrate transport system substrate-binding protein
MSKSKEDVATTQREFTATGIVLTRAQFQKEYAMVSGEATMKLKVSSVSKEMPVLNGEGEQVFDKTDGRALTKHIINLKAIPDRHFAAVRQVWGKRDSIDLGELNGLTLSINAIVPASGELDLPMNGTFVSTNTSYLTDDEGEFRLNDDGKKIVVINKFAVPAIAKAPTFVLDELEVEEPA